MNRALVRLPAVHSEGRPGVSHLHSRPPGPQRKKRALITGITRQHGPELALLGILLITAGSGYEDRLPALSVGITLQIPDILLLGSLGLIAVRCLVMPEFRIVRTPLDRPLLIFYGVTLFSTLVAIVQSSLALSEAISRIRIFSFYLTFFVVTNLIKERRQINFLLNGILLWGTILAVAMIAQYLLGDSVQLVRAQAGAFVTQGRFEASARVSPPGLSIVMVSLVTSACLLVLARFRPLGLLRCVQCALLGMAFLVTFLRSYWAGIIVVMVLMGILVRGADRRRLIGLGVWGVAVLFTAALAMNVIFVNAPDSRVARLLDASWDRYSTLGRSGTFEGRDDNVEYRKLEYRYAVPAIESSPIIGSGMGSAYRPFDPRLDGRVEEFFDTRNLIHNGHLTVLLQSGLVGYLSLLWLSVAFLMRGFGNWRQLPDERMRGVVLSFTLVYLAAFVAALGNSLFMLSFWTPLLGIIMGINEVVLRKVRLGEVMV